MQDNAALAAKQIDAQASTAQLNALAAVTQSNNAAGVQVAQITANTNAAAIAASIFGTAVSGLTANSNTGGADLSAFNNGTFGVANGTALVPGGPGWQSWMDPFAHSGNSVPIYGATGNSGQATNVTNNQIEELFNNVIRVAQGTSPLQTVTMQPSGPTVAQTGSATIDPVFAVWDGHGATPTITDVTLNPNSQYGYTGSVFNPATMDVAKNITPNAVAAPVVPIPVPNFGNFNWNF